MIDTTIYSLEPSENISDTCYKHLFQSNTHEKISELIELQESQLTKVLQENIDIQNNISQIKNKITLIKFILSF